MDESNIVRVAQLSLQPFIKKSQDASQIRQILALHLHTPPISQPISLVDHPLQVSTSSIKGIRREYARCVEANIKARDEYRRVRKDYQVHNESDRHDRDDGSENSLDSFLKVIKYRRKHERLRILQDYIDTLAQKPAAASDHLDPEIVLKDLDSLPSVPTDVMNRNQPNQEPQRTDLDDLVRQLEKSVLKAKSLLKREQKLLSSVQAGDGAARASAGSRLQALGTARNELINWIETELANAGESSADADGPGMESTKKKGKDYIDSQLSSIQRQYAKYVKARQALISAATWSPEMPTSTGTEDDTTTLILAEESEKTGAMNHVLHPYLEELTSVSNQQKSTIQQKSHLTTTLFKQSKEAGQGLDRQAEESHLLPAYPLPSSKRKGQTFGDEMSSLEKPDSSRRAKGWVHAANAAGKATRQAVAGNLEEGEVSLLDAHQTLLDLEYLLGRSFDAEKGSGNVAEDIWAALDGNLGVINRDGGEEM